MSSAAPSEALGGTLPTEANLAASQLTASEQTASAGLMDLASGACHEATAKKFSCTVIAQNKSNMTQTASASPHHSDESYSGQQTDSRVFQKQVPLVRLQSAQDAELTLPHVEAAQRNVQQVLKGALQGEDAQQLKAAIHLAVRCLASADPVGHIHELCWPGCMMIKRLFDASEHLLCCKLDEPVELMCRSRVARWLQNASYRPLACRVCDLIHSVNQRQVMHLLAGMLTAEQILSKVCQRASYHRP